MALRQSEAIEVKRVRGKGRGVFARRFIGRGEVIESVPMLVMTAEEFENNVAGTALASYFFAWGTGQAALALGYGSLYNHSYRPNARYDDVGPRTKEFSALRNIEPGEEITVNYNGAPKPAGGLVRGGGDFIVLVRQRSRLVSLRQRSLTVALLTSLLTACPLISRAGQGPPRQPSILVILPDQLRGQNLGCMGDRDVRTPHLDSLAAEGLLFRNTFANTPVCCPARAILWTGKYPHKNGMVANDLRLRESETTIAEVLAAQGYRTGFIGKWHLDGGPRLPGFVPPGPRRQGFHFWAANECSHAHFHPTYFRDTDRPITDDRFEPEVWTDRAIEFLRAAGTGPFFLVVSMGPPHDPYGAPPPFMKLYDPARLTMRPNWVAGTRGASRGEIAGYDAAITAVDEQVGRLLKELETLGKARDTIVLVTSDHGDMLGAHGQRLKRKPWEESIRVPGILRYPARVKPGRMSAALLSHVDLAPTLLALCGVPIPAEMQGADLSPVVLGQTDQGPDSVFFQIFVPFLGVARRSWRVSVVRDGAA